MRNYMLIYHNENLTPTGYTYLNFQSDCDFGRFTLGYVFIFVGGAISWKSMKQSCIVDSAMEVEYVAACEATNAVGLRNSC